MKLKEKESIKQDFPSDLTTAAFFISFLHFYGRVSVLKFQLRFVTPAIGRGLAGNRSSDLSRFMAKGMNQSAAWRQMDRLKKKWRI